MINMTNLFPYSNRKQENKKLFKEGKPTASFCRWLWVKIGSALLAISISTFSFSASASVAEDVLNLILKPTVSVSANTSATENVGYVTFTFRKSTTATLTSINYRITETGDFLRYKAYWSIARTVTDSDGVWSTKSVGATILNDSIDETDGSVTATVLSGDGYDVSSSAGSATITIRDDDKSTISIEAQNTSLTEGSTVRFRFTRPVGTQQVVVYHSTSQVGDNVIWRVPLYTTISSGARQSAWIEILTYDNNYDNTPGSITMTVDSNSAYIRHTTNHTATVTMNDDDKPTISVEAQNTSVTEGGTVRFRLTRGARTERVVVYISTSQDGDYVFQPVPPSKAISAGALHSDWIEITTLDNFHDNNPGSITMAVDSNSAYRRHSTGRSATVTVADNEIPTVSVTALYESRIENQTPRFTLDKVTTGDEITVYYNYTESGSFLNAGALNTFFPKIMSSNSTTRNFGVAVNYDDIDEADGSVTVTLAKTDQYNVHETNYAATTKMLDDDAPVISVETYESLVTEGEYAWFKLIRPARSERVSVRYRVSESGDFIYHKSRFSSDLTRTLRKGYAYRWVSVRTRDDNTDESSGTITLTVLTDNSGSDYTRHATNHTATVTIIDNDAPAGTSSSPVLSFAKLPEVEIQAVNATVTEGESARFWLRSTGFFSGGLAVSVTLAQSGDFIVGDMVRSVALFGGVGEELAVQTVDDRQHEADGSITAVIEQDESYVVSSLRTAVVSVLDNDPSDAERRHEIAEVLSTVQPAVVGGITSSARVGLASRVSQAFNAPDATSLSLGGNTELTDMLSYGLDMAKSGEVSLSSVIDNSSFVVELLPDSAEPGLLSLWGYGNRHDLLSEESGTALGDLSSGRIGIDARVGPDLLLGFASSFSESEADYTGNGSADIKGTYSISTTGAHPYFGWSTPDDVLNLHASAGYEQGNVTVVQNGYDAETAGTEFLTASLSVRQLLYDSASQFHLKMDAWTVEQRVMENGSLIDEMRFRDHRLFAAAEGSHRFEMAGGSLMDLLASAGVGWNGMSERTGLELDWSAEYKGQFGLNLTGSGHGVLESLAMPAAWGIKSALEYDRGNDELGVIFNLSPQWNGRIDENNGSITGYRLASSGESNDGLAVEAGIGYGVEFASDSWLFTPRSGIGLSDNDRNYAIGASLSSGETVSFDFEWATNGLSGSNGKQEAKVSGLVNW